MRLGPRSQAGWPDPDGPLAPPVRRFRRVAGVTADDVRYWRDRLVAVDRSPEELDLWQQRVFEALSNLASYAKGRRARYTRHSGLVGPYRCPDRHDLRCSSDTPGESFVPQAAAWRAHPGGKFRAHHERALDAIQRAQGDGWPERPAWWQLGALALLDLKPPGRSWREELREEIRERLLAPPLLKESDALDQLGCDVRRFYVSESRRRSSPPNDDEAGSTRQPGCAESFA